MMPARVLALVAALVLVVVVAPPAVASPTDCAGITELRDSSAATSGVLFVHGIRANTTSTWLSPPDRPAGSTVVLPDLVENESLDVWAFDYGRDALQWVTHPNLGPRLAQAIDCLHRVTGVKVPVVAHSMGGLMTQFAANQTVDGRKVANALGPVVTIGTPYAGSDLLEVVRVLMDGASVDAAKSLLTGVGGTPALVVLALRGVVAGCGALGSADAELAGQFCLDAAIPDTPAGAALRPKSDVSQLQRWPDGIRVREIAGDVQVGVRAFGLTFKPMSIGGDVPVTTTSATAGVGRDNHTAACQSGLNVFAADCWHRGLPYWPKTWELAQGLVAPRLVLEPGGLGAVSFGDKMDPVVATLRKELGEPDYQVENVCDGPDGRGFLWGRLYVVFRERGGAAVFTDYQYGGSIFDYRTFQSIRGTGGPDLRTRTGIGLGSISGEIDAAYGPEASFSPLGGAKAVPFWLVESDDQMYLSIDLDGDTPSSRVVSFGGDGCGE